MYHMQMLESAGLVQCARLPSAAMSHEQNVAAARTVHAAGAGPTLSPALLGLLGAGLAGLAGIAAVRLMRRRRPAIDPRTGALRS